MNRLLPSLGRTLTALARPNLLGVALATSGPEVPRGTVPAHIPRRSTWDGMRGRSRPGQPQVEDGAWVINRRRKGARRPWGFAVPATRYGSDFQVGVSPVDGNAREIAFVNSVFACLNSADGGSNVTWGAGAARNFPEPKAAFPSPTSM